MSRSRLPPPPGRSGGRPLPPEPPGESTDAPPPLPNRPGHGGKSHGGGRLPPPPVQNGQSPESSDEDGQTYEEPDMPPPPPQSRHAPPPAPSPEPFEQETYDDLEDVQPEQIIDEPGETYDECDMKPAVQQQDQPTYEDDEQLYEEEPPSDDYPPHPEPVEESDCLYEFMPDNDSAPSPPPPPPSTHHRPHIPLPPQPNSAPSLPARPPPARPPDRDPSPESVPELPGRPAQTAKVGRKVSGEGPQIGISLEQIGLKRANLKKVADEAVKPQESVTRDEPDESSNDSNSVKARINMFKQVEKGVKPPVATKPLMPVKPQLISKPGEVKSPPPVVKSSPTPPVKSPPIVKPAAPVAAPSFEECDDIYDEGFSYVPDPMSKEEWYHGEIERSDTNTRLMSIGQDGTFLVRKSKQGGDSQPYTLAVLYEGHVYNLKMRIRSDGQVALGEEKSDELAFKDVPALIQHHKSHEVILLNVKEKKQNKTKLKRHPINVNA